MSSTNDFVPRDPVTGEIDYGGPDIGHLPPERGAHPMTGQDSGRDVERVENEKLAAFVKASPESSEHQGRFHLGWVSAADRDRIVAALTAAAPQGGESGWETRDAYIIELCAKVADGYPEQFGEEFVAHGLIGHGQDSAARDIAERIRALSPSPPSATHSASMCREP